MRKFFKSFQPTSWFALLRWVLLAIPLSIMVGSTVAIFLFLLQKATDLRWANGWLLWLLPVAGVVIHFIYKYLGADAERGNNLVIDEIHEPGTGVPARMGPMVVVTTIVTHLFGGSAGREGTAVQAGGSMAAMLGRWLKLPKSDIQVLLMMGVAAGFGAVFGTPLAGCIFALEVLVVGRFRYQALLPCLFASLMADAVVRFIGIPHARYTVLFSNGSEGWFHGSAISFLFLGKIILAAVAFGLVSAAFAWLCHNINTFSKKVAPKQWLIPLVGGCIIIALTYLVGTRDYLGLGVYAAQSGGVSIINAFQPGGADYFSWFWKLLFTAITLGTGFKGGEVTPLFFIGATLGCSLAMVLGMPVDLMAALGFVAVFAGATNTPLASTIMAVELFGGEHILLFALACFVAYYFSGKSGIYTAQKRLTVDS